MHINMNVSVFQKDLSQSVFLTTRFVSKTAQLPILENVLLKATKNKLQLIATNLEMSVLANIAAKVSEEGEIAVPARTLSEIITNLQSEQVKLISDEEILKITTDTTSVDLSGMNTSDFPDVPSKIPDSAIFIPAMDFIETLSQVSFAASRDETRPQLTGVLFIMEPDSLKLVASDGFRLSQKIINISTKTKVSRVIIPKNILLELQKGAKEEDEIKLFINEADNEVLFSWGDCIFSSRVIEGEFPNFERIIPKSSSVTANFDKEEFAKVIKVASVFARDTANIVKIKVDEDNLSVRAESSRSGRQEARIPAKVEGDGVEISFNFKFIEDFLAVSKSSEIEIALTNTTSPGIFKDISSPDFLHLIMPVRVQEQND